MRLLIFGPRDLHDRPTLVRAILESGFPIYAITEVVCGCADGVDWMGGHWWAPEHDISVKHFPANWREHKKAAGPLRNEQMARYLAERADSAAVGLWDGVRIRGNGSRSGTADMIARLERHRIKHYVHRFVR